MAKRKKYPKLPNGFGSIKYLGKNRTNPYAVYPAAKEDDQTGKYPTPKAICYVDEWYKGFAVLVAHNAGNYVPGYEQTLNFAGVGSADLSETIRMILADYGQIARRDIVGKTFKDVYTEYYTAKFESGKRSYSEATKSSARAAFKNCEALHDKPFTALRAAELQQVIDGCPLRHASLELIVNLLHQMYAYAIAQDIIDKDYSAAIKINISDDDEHGVPFTEDELRVLWAHKDNEVAEMLLIMCYSGYRISAYKTMEVNLQERYFKGGVKTRTSKDRIVPIHPAILPLVTRRMRRDGLLLASVQAFRKAMYNELSRLGIVNHTPHDCRHTFSRLTEKYGVREADRRRMLGHSFGADITNGVYGHRELKDLRTELEKVKICC